MVISNSATHLASTLQISYLYHHLLVEDEGLAMQKKGTHRCCSPLCLLCLEDSRQHPNLKQARFAWALVALVTLVTLVIGRHLIKDSRLVRVSNKVRALVLSFIQLTLLVVVVLIVVSVIAKVAKVGGCDDVR